MSAMWKVRDILDRIEKEQEPVGLYLNWADWYTMVPHTEAVKVLRRLHPDTELKTNYSGGTMFIGYNDHLLRRSLEPQHCPRHAD